MEPIRISSPTATAAFVLVELLDEYHATANFDEHGRWQVVVPLDESGPSRVCVISATREWLERCGLPFTSITLDGQTHLLQGSRIDALAADNG
jgi:hypothetical protein